MRKVASRPRTPILAALQPSPYAHPLYAASLAEFGDPVRLPRSGGHLLRRAVPGTGAADAVGPYPLFACTDWTGLADDLAGLEGLVSVVLVPDPLTAPDDGTLERAFPDLARPYKVHFVADLTRPEGERTSPHHRRRLRRLPPRLTVERVDAPREALDDWTALYDRLALRHGIRGISRFSRASFAAQLAVPGLVAYRAAEDGVAVGMALWFRSGPHAWYHLGASSERGYAVGSAYAVFRRALDDLRDDGVRVADLGGAAGLADDPSDGLARFKRGWATGTATARLCGRVLDPGTYARLVLERPGGADDYFPAYRRAEAAGS